jgi:hypothetical protein
MRGSGIKNDTYHTDVSFWVLFDDAAKHAIPIRPAKVCRRTQRGNCVLFSSDVRDLLSDVIKLSKKAEKNDAHDDVLYVVIFDFRCEIDVDLDAILSVLFLNGM